MQINYCVPLGEMVSFSHNDDCFRCIDLSYKWSNTVDEVRRKTDKTLQETQSNNIQYDFSVNTETLKPSQFDIFVVVCNVYDTAPCKTMTNVLTIV